MTAAIYVLRQRSFALCLAASLLAGCASFWPTAPGAESISGRLSVHVDAAGSNKASDVSGAFELQGSPSAGQLNLSTPLGTVVAQARWTGKQAWMVTSDGETAYADLDSLTREMLGESLPVAALFDWLKGRPWPGAPSQVNTIPAEPGFQQLGWTISLARFSDGLVAAERRQAPRVTVRARIDQP